MKKLLTILCLLILVSCSNEVPDDKLVERDGIIYEVNSTTPFTGSSVSYHENGQLNKRENYKNGQQDGPSEWFHENGQLGGKGNYKNGEQDGLHERFYENGQLRDRVNFKDGKEDGPWEYFDEDGNLNLDDIPF